MNLSDQGIELYKQEVCELTSLFHSEWKEMRNILTKKIDVEDSLLCFFVEGVEDDYGIILTKDNELYEFEIMDGKLNNIVKQKKAIRTKVPQVDVALQLQKEKF